MSPQAHSDYCNTDVSPPISGGVLVMEYRVDGGGYVCGPVTIRNPLPGEVVGHEGKAEVAELPAEDVCWPLTVDGMRWPRDAHNRGVSVLEANGPQSIAAEQRRTLRHIRQYLATRRAA